MNNLVRGSASFGVTRRWEWFEAKVKPWLGVDRHRTAAGPDGELIRSKARRAMTPKPLKVEARSDHRIWIRYSDGTEGEVDLSRFAGRGVFKLWNDPEAFRGVHIGPGNAISWSDEVELCPDSVYMWLTGRSPEDLFPRLRDLRQSA